MFVVLPLDCLDYGSSETCCGLIEGCGSAGGDCSGVKYELYILRLLMPAEQLVVRRK